jgi:hypothetical protein
MNKILKVISHLLLVIFIIAPIVIPTIAVSAIADPTTLTLDNITAYQSVIDTNDQLFIAKFTIDYAAYPTDETANTAFLFRMFDSTAVEISSVALYANPYFNDGFGQGIVSIYFTPDEVTSLGLAWSEAHNFYLAGNPSANWTGAAPSTAATPVTTWSTTSGAVAIRVSALANTFQSAWGYQLIDTGTLTTYGENYFVTTIPYLRIIAPSVFQSSTEPATEFRERAHGLTYAITLRNQWLGTWLDMTTPAADWGVDAIWIYGLMWLAVMIAIGWVTVSIGSSYGQSVTVDNKPLLYVEALTMFFGGLIGFLPWLAAVLVGVIFIFMILNQLFFSRSSG